MRVSCQYGDSLWIFMYYIAGTDQPSPYRYCYVENASTIFFLHLTNKSDHWSPVETCAFKSAAIMNPESGVCVLTLYPMQEHESLIILPNLEIAPLDIDRLFQNTPLENWSKSFNASQSSIFVWEMSNALRYAYLFQFGGKYLDTDVWTLRNLSNLTNVAGWQDEWWICHAVFFFEKGHPFVKAILDNFMDNFKLGSWGSVGPQLVTKIHKNGTVDSSTYTLLDEDAFYPTHYMQYKMPFMPKKTSRVKKLIDDSYVLHLWHYMVVLDDGEKRYYESPPEGSFAYQFIHDGCRQQ